MDTCRFRSSCTYVDDLRQRRPVTLDNIKKRYCDSNYFGCARFMVSQVHGPACVSRYLFPEDVEEACSILSSEA